MVFNILLTWFLTCKYLDRHRLCGLHSSSCPRSCKYQGQACSKNTQGTWSELNKHEISPSSSSLLLLVCHHYCCFRQCGPSSGMIGSSALSFLSALLGAGCISCKKTVSSSWDLMNRVLEGSERSVRIPRLSQTPKAREHNGYIHYGFQSLEFLDSNLCSALS